ncbi:hypothetical protein FHR49_001571 [Xanthomonas campestris]
MANHDTKIYRAVLRTDTETAIAHIGRHRVGLPGRRQHAGKRDGEHGGCQNEVARFKNPHLAILKRQPARSFDHRAVKRAWRIGAAYRPRTSANHKLGKPCRRPEQQYNLGKRVEHRWTLANGLNTFRYRKYGY